MLLIAKLQFENFFYLFSRGMSAKLSCVEAINILLVAAIKK